MSNRCRQADEAHGDSQNGHRRALIPGLEEKRSLVELGFGAMLTRKAPQAAREGE
jgi:hypothetical protein